MKIDQKDIVIVGGGTAGVYFGWLMAKKGFSVIIIEKDSREKVAERLDVIHLLYLLQTHQLVLQTLL
jgi:flavin-dependent dehydrogenase